jgi:hypothetical protein
MSATPTLAPDAAFVLGVAATAIPFARTPEDEAERWLRLLRLHGAVGATLQALGVSEASLASNSAHPATRSEAGSARTGGSVDDRQHDVIALVGERAARLADERGADGIGTTELLLGVLEVYGDVFERTLRAHGTDSSEVLERLAA